MEKYVHLRNDYNEELEFYGIPFRVQRDRIITCLPGGNRINSVDLPVNGSNDWNLKFPYCCRCLFFLGMATDGWKMSEWWGQQAYYYDHSDRVFIGDKIGRIKVIYSDETEDLFPIIFGVNCWNYHLFYGAHDYEQIATFGAPYNEPFKSDPQAGLLLKESLRLMENSEPASAVEKNTKWVFGVRVSPDKTISVIQLIRDESKKCDFAVSAITGLTPEFEPDPGLILTDIDFYLGKKYYKNMDKLARRLYQFRSDIPQSVDKIEIDGFDAPDVIFYGSGQAEIFTNIYRRNIYDMAYQKINDDGHVNVSSRERFDYGCYIGFGTFNKAGVGECTWTRDAGRSLTEALMFGYSKRCIAAADYLTKCLYTANYKFKHPQWKRIANVRDDDENLLKVCKGKENDGHASIMLFIFNLFNNGVLSLDWLYKNRKSIYDAADFFIWQSENPVISNFDRVFFSETEASTQTFGGYDLFSNIYAVNALKGYSKILNAMHEHYGGTDDDLCMAEKCMELAEKVYAGCNERFTMEHPRYGDVYTDTLDDCWTYEYKRFCDLFLRADIDGYDLRFEYPEVADKVERSFFAQKEIYYNAFSGRQMGYGQGYLTETVLLLDLFDELTECVDAAAMMTYHHTDDPYMVPEGVIIHGSGNYWYRQADLGNSVQQGEVIKIVRLILGIDDISRRANLRIVPRLPDTWSGYSVRNFYITDSTYERIPVNISYRRVTGGFSLCFAGENEVAFDYLRFGPFDKNDTCTSGDIEQIRSTSSVCINGRYFVYVYLNKKCKNFNICVCEK